MFLLNSCVDVKQLAYIQDYKDSAMQQLKYYEPVIQKGDVLSIIVTTQDANTNSLLNQPNGIGGSSSGAMMAGGGANLAGYLVDPGGNIEFPLLGTLHVEGMKKSHLRDTLQRQLLAYIKQPPIVNIRYLNFRVTVLGEVSNPGTISIANERMNVLEAIGQVNNLTNYGRRDNVLIIREENGQRTSGRLDLRSAKIFESPFFYLKQNDIIMVDMNKNKITWSDQGAVRNISALGAIIGTVSILLTTILLIRK